MNRTSIDRLTEALAVLCVAAALVILYLPAGAPAVEASLARLTVQAVPDEDMSRFQGLLEEARRQVDANSDPEQLLDQLKELYPGRHEVWALVARHRESAGRDHEALSAYGRAVRLYPDYLDERSGLYLGKRIEVLTARVMDELRTLRSEQGLDPPGRELLKTAYFLKRRLAGGCE